jgi:hypothetical protein
MNRNALITGFVGVVLLAGIAGTLVAEDRDAATFTKTSSCKMCHKKDAKGNQAKVWAAGPHAKAYALLATAEAKAIGAKAGVADPQKSGKCLQCHSTAYNNTEKLAIEVIKVEDGVTCQSCHGGGKDYKKKSVMKDVAKAIAAGMVKPATKSCVRCHNEKSATWNPERYTTADGKKVGFDEKQAYEKIKHPRKK